MKYQQYMYHFCYPKNSIDVRRITKADRNWCTEQLKRWGKLSDYGKRFSGSLKQDVKFINKMYLEHFPEELI